MLAHFDLETFLALVNFLSRFDVCLIDMFCFAVVSTQCSIGVVPLKTVAAALVCVSSSHLRDSTSLKCFSHELWVAHWF